MQSIRTSALRVSRSAPRRFASTHSSQPENPPAGRSNALVVAGVIGAGLAGLGYYNYRQTGSPDRIAKAMAKTGTPSQRSGGLGKMEAENKKLHYGEDSPEATEPADKRPPTRRPA